VSSLCCAGALTLFSEASVAIDGSKFRSRQHAGPNFTQGPGLQRPAGWRKMTKALPLPSRSLIARIVRAEAVRRPKITRLNEKIATLRPGDLPAPEHH